MFLLKGIIGALAQTAIIGMFLLLPAWTWQWKEANQFLICYVILNVISTVFLAIKAPKSLEARMEIPIDGSQPLSDRIATTFLLIFLIGWFIFIPIDVFHLRLLAPPQATISFLGGLLTLFSYGIMLLAIYQNEFITPVVRDQSDRGHELRDTGLYGLIRHPFYAGFVLFCTGVALWLQSYAALAVGLLPITALIGRIYAEEKILQKTLPGYEEYMLRTRYRIMPFIW
ncbi:MAG: isoprenylcysteine carboxylmethyltransferase family protein [Pseudomonadota bacterium]|nr:isoprenylcysteine carboxylmethyltransferase family protein [Pseudomonadota bacterium]